MTVSKLWEWSMMADACKEQASLMLEVFMCTYSNGIKTYESVSSTSKSRLLNLFVLNLMQWKCSMPHKFSLSALLPLLLQPVGKGPHLFSSTSWQIKTGSTFGLPQSVLQYVCKNASTVNHNHQLEVTQWVMLASLALPWSQNKKVFLLWLFCTIGFALRRWFGTIPSEHWAVRLRQLA